ncbi:predicted protein [Sclerotinia sclerotiorum 1980 UF-70]|uniref:Uncharacterized protein n=1 Tax=Sclerotinia sclerotiorum (strain ATCC 18683 / 1980 / Ss-1) TaxID=665079 RepID=A7ETX2_SCLS1|nr:predicted protein [Sclerotinia sclerotiorum 1980 UF-70]EDN92914.1 predicted protein [Sclerotinia sclerotiorum 1980 UF-70]
MYECFLPEYYLLDIMLLQTNELSAYEGYLIEINWYGKGSQVPTRTWSTARGKER